MTTTTNKPVIVHVIDDLSRGGAETLLLDLLSDLNKYYDVVLVNLRSHSEFDESYVKCAHRYILNYTQKIQFPFIVYRLKQIIRKHKPVLVRSQLYWSTIIARLACPKNIPFIFSIHVTHSDETFLRTRKGNFLKWLEKKTYKSRHTLIGVTKEVIEDYDRIIGVRGKTYLLYNYVNNAYFSNAINYSFSINGILKMVAVGNVKRQKNYSLLVNAFEILKDPGITCDIYGMGDSKALQQTITANKLTVNLKGQSDRVFELLRNYDAFIMCSIYEGFGISVAEAMAAGLPLILSDLPVLREISHGNAVFFDPYDANDLADKIQRFRNGEYDANAMSVKGKQISRDNYSKKAYLERLLKIYSECTGKPVPEPGQITS